MAQHLLLELQSCSLISRAGPRIWVIIVAISLVCPLGRVESTATAPPILLGSDTVILDPTLEAGLSAVTMSVSEGLKTLPSAWASQISVDQKGMVLPKRGWFFNSTARGLSGKNLAPVTMTRTFTWLCTLWTALVLPDHCTTRGQRGFRTAHRRSLTFVLSGAVPRMQEVAPGAWGAAGPSGSEAVCSTGLKRPGNRRSWTCWVSGKSLLSRFFSAASCCLSQELPVLRTVVGDRRLSKTSSQDGSGLGALLSAGSLGIASWAALCGDFILNFGAINNGGLLRSFPSKNHGVCPKPGLGASSSHHAMPTLSDPGG